MRAELDARVVGLQLPLEEAIDVVPGADERDGDAGGHGGAHEWRAAAGDVLGVALSHPLRVRTAQVVPGMLERTIEVQ